MPPFSTAALARVHLFGPARGADHGVDASGGEPLDVRENRGGSGEINGHVDAAKALARDALAVFIFRDIQPQGNGEAVLGRELLHEMAHFAVTDDRQIHSLYSKTAGSTLLKNSWCSNLTAFSASRAATTKPILSTEAP